MSNSTSHDPRPVGWVHSPNGRGTIDILWSCGVTIILCTWSVVCVNVSAPTSGAWRLFIRKIWLALMCSLGPEFLLALAVGQWQSARRSTKDFHGEEFTGWTMKHAFYADMGGFHLKLSDIDQFPLDSAKIIWLFRQGYLSRERLESEILLPKREIEDRNKADNTVRLITTLQTIWFVINIIGRAIQHLAITTMELTVCGFIVTTLPVIFFWSHKPADIATSQIIHLDISSDTIRQKAGGKALEPWYRTPLDFLEEPLPWLALGWFYFVHILRRIHLMPWRSSRLVTKIHDDNFQPVTGWQCMCNMLLLTSMCLAINLSAWNFWFPTKVERQLWRSSAIATFALIWIGLVHSEWIVPVLPHRDNVMTRVRSLPGTSLKSVSSALEKAESFADRLRNNTPDGDPAFTVTLRLIVPGLVVAALYSIARAYQMLESIVNLRLQPPGVYETVNWGGFLPHAG